MSREQQNEQAKACGRVVAEAWSDETFKQRLMAEPAAVLAAEGVAVAEGTELRIVDNTDKLVYLTLPAKPDELQLSDQRLAQIAGGGSPNNVYGYGTIDALKAYDPA